jgi:hypothetical protein
MKHLLLILIVLPVSLCGQRNLPADSVDETADEIFTIIKDRHPFAASLEGLEALEAARTQVQSEVKEAVKGRDSVSYPEFVQLMAPMQEVTGCGHLILEPHFDSLESITIRENHLPLRMMLAEDGRHVLMTGLRTTRDTFSPGTEVMAIDGEPIGPLLQSLSYFSGLNDQGNDHAGLMKVIRFPSTYYQWHYGLKKQLNLTLKNDDGEVLEEVVLSKYQPYVDAKKVKTDIGKTLAFRFSEDGQTGILDINKFSSYKFNNGNYYKFIRSVFDMLQQTSTQQLIIDIRDNGGGSSGRISALYRYLSDREFQFSSATISTGTARALPGETGKVARRRAAGAVTKKERRIQKSLTRKIKPVKEELQFSGRVVVLVNELSFSASGIFARYVQGSGRGKLVGMPAGASAGITYGAKDDGKKTYVGPDDEFEIKVNTIGLVPEFPESGNVTPDVIVPVTVAALRAGRDEQLERALEVVGGK